MLKEIIIGAVAYNAYKKQKERDEEASLRRMREFTEAVPQVTVKQYSGSFEGQNAVEAARALLGCGFDCVTLEPVYVLHSWDKRRYGRVKSISINGDSTFSSGTRFPVSAYILIKYLDFQEYDAYVMSQVKEIVPGEMWREQVERNGSFSDLGDTGEYYAGQNWDGSKEPSSDYAEYKEQKTWTEPERVKEEEPVTKTRSDSEPDAGKGELNFCPYCGTKISVQGALFCVKCGKKIM